tara:strand:- start:142 stop:1488 length:1347 start_codon:yes stop_codon:yes gene_type:complete
MWGTIFSIIMGVGQAAYGARNQRKAQEKSEQNALYQRLTIEGQAPQLGTGQGFEEQPIMGSEISDALSNLRYDPNASFTQMLQSSDVQQQELPPEVLEQLMMEQQGQFASGGPVGRPEDTYYFTVEDIQGMMQEPDPMMQAVGAGLMGQMPPGGGMVPATPGQIQMMANGGQPLYRDMGGQTNIMTTDPRDVGPDYDEIVMLDSSEDGDELVEGVDYFMIDGEMVWPWEFEERQQARVNEEMSGPVYGMLQGGKRKKYSYGKFGPGKRKKGSKPVFSAAQRYDMDRMIDAARKSGRTITPTDRENLEIVMEEVPIRRQEGGITAVKKLENTLSELVGINPKDVEWASSLSEEMYPGEELDGRGDAARHLALGSLIAKAEHPNAAEALSVLREYIPIPDSGRKMDMFNNDLGMTLTGSKPEIKKQIRELIDSNTAKFINLDESQKMRGY